MQMNCPNCGSPYDPDEIICPNCGQPLSNASYTSVDPGKKKPKKRRWRRILLIIILVIIAAVIVYRIYIREVKKQCQNVVSLVFDTASGMDFSTAATENLPDFMQSDSAIEDFIESRFDTILAPYHLDGLSEYFSNVPDLLSDLTGENFREVLSAITESADYEITEVTADYHSCTVAVRTENTDFLSLASNVAQGVTEEIEEIRAVREAEAAEADEADGADEETKTEQEDSASDSFLWDRVRNAFSSLFHPADSDEVTDSKESGKSDDEAADHGHEEEDAITDDGISAGDDETTESTDGTVLNDSDFLTDVFYPILEEARENTGTVSADGTFVFGIRDGKWTLVSVDNELFYCFFGISLPSGS